ncbi:mandelate racemase/muconate lactonizing enzyme family protein [Jiangella ureilytica]|uniref:Mandelate racemase/muconate lactonizing enzyme family protein n=2 Tax=Jiangella ureilytica TaxID=2530374 RepID=A0A4R4RGP9_9ACTN|nr:mandelate racemase/muconate lactonizing enzyme family protein [Jiangella ureilytica]
MAPDSISDDDMRITEVGPVLLTGPSSNDPWITFAKRLRTAAFVEIRTDAGLTGIGETYAGYFGPELVGPVVDYVRPILVGADTTDPRELTARMRRSLTYIARVGAGAAVISAVEAALWDLAGKAEGVPVHQLLGGARYDRLPAYATGGPSPWPPEQLKRKLDRYLELGFTAVKVASGYLDQAARTPVPSPRGPEGAAQVEVEKVEMLRAQAGPDVGIMLDGHMGHRGDRDRWDLTTATAVLTALGPYGLTFFEEPLPYLDPGEYAELTRVSPVPVAGGEQLSSYDEFRLWMDRDAFAVAQPDASWLGPSEFVDVGRLAARRGAMVASHAWSAGAGVMQNIHAAFASPSALIVEIPPDAGELHTLLWGDNLVIEDGHVLRPDAPGLGVTLTDEVKERFPFRPGMEEFASVPGKRLRS